MLDGTLINVIVFGICIIVMVMLFIVMEWRVRCHLAEQRLLVAAVQRILRERESDHRHNNS